MSANWNSTAHALLSLGGRLLSPLPAQRGGIPVNRLAGCEALEHRWMMAGDLNFDPSPHEQEMLEYINRMRMNPAAELEVLFLSVDPASPNFLVSADPNINAAMDYFDVDKNLLLSQWGALESAPPLAWSNGLQQAASTHNTRMILQDLQSHQLPANAGLGLAAEADLTTRIEAAGYLWNTGFALGENIYAFGSSVLYGHAGFVVDWGFTTSGIQNPPGHRINIMNPTYEEVGVSVVYETSSATRVGEYVITQDFGWRDNYGNPRVLGVVYTESTGNTHYNAGEGAAGVILEFTSHAGTFSTTTMTAGGYQLQLAPGTYAVTAHGGPLTGRIDIGTVEVANENVKLDIETSNAQPMGGVVSGLVWEDINQNGIQDSGEGPRGGAVVYLDADDDGVLDGSELSATSSANGQYHFPSVPAGSYKVRIVLNANDRLVTPGEASFAVSVVDGSAISGKNFGVFEWLKIVGNTAEVHGTPFGDTVSWSINGGNHQITVNNISTTINSVAVPNVMIIAKGGTDTLTLNAGAANDTAVVRSGTTLLTSSDYAITGKNFEVVYIDGGGGNNIRANLYDTPGDDYFIGRNDYSRLYGNGFWFEVKNFQRVFGYATAGGDDRANLFDGATNDLFYGRSNYALMRGASFEFYNYAQGFDKAFAYAVGGGTDKAYLYDDSTDDTYIALDTYALLRGPNSEFYNYASGFDEVQAYANNGGNDTAKLYDSPGSDKFYAYPTRSFMQGPDSIFLNQANGFDVVSGYSYNPGTDYAYLYDAASDDLFLGYDLYSLMRGPNSEFYNEAFAFDRVYAMSVSGGVDYAYLYDSAGADRFFGLDTYSVMRGANFEYYNQVTGFDRVYGTSTLGGNDIAYLYDSAGDDRYFGLAEYSIMRGLNFEYYNYASGFRTVRSVASNGGQDIATLYDSAGVDRIVALQDYAQLTGLGRDEKIVGFDRINAHSINGGADSKNVGTIDFVFRGFGAWA